MGVESTVMILVLINLMNCIYYTKSKWEAKGAEWNSDSEVKIDK
jgi:hypothetical protein